MRVLVFIDYYRPGYKAGGPVHSVSRVLDQLADEVEFSVFTRDRDLGDLAPYPSVEAGTWKDGCFYARPDQVSRDWVLAAIRRINPDVIYCNSYFSILTRCVLWLRWTGRLGATAVLVAPRGEFSPGALKLKSWRKRLFLTLGRWARLHRRVSWQVSSDLELRDAREVVAVDHFVVKPPDVAPLTEAGPPTRVKYPGAASFAFLSRISPKKNLLGAIEMLGRVEGRLSLTVYGPIEDEAYWAKCEAAAAAWPTNLTFVYAGPIRPEEVADRLAQHHYFLFPTLGENFGHVIAEALASGSPPLLSDQTPWTELDARGAGACVPLEDEQGWRDILRGCVDCDQPRYDAMVAAARAYVADVSRQFSDPALNLRVFEEARDYAQRAA